VKDMHVHVNGEKLDIKARFLAELLTELGDLKATGWQLLSTAKSLPPLNARTTVFRSMTGSRS